MQMWSSLAKKGVLMQYAMVRDSGPDEPKFQAWHHSMLTLNSPRLQIYSAEAER